MPLKTSSVIKDYVSTMPKKPDPFTLKVAKEMHAGLRSAARTALKNGTMKNDPLTLTAKTDRKTEKASLLPEGILEPWSRLDPVFADGYYHQADLVLAAVKRLKATSRAKARKV